MAPTIKRIFIALVVALLFAGCSTVQVSERPDSRPVQAVAPAFAQAKDLAANDAALSGQAKVDNARQIERLLSGLDNAGLSANTAMLPAGDPLYAFAGRALLRRGLPLPRSFDRGAQWRFDAGNRPPADRDGYRPPLKLAVLLPLSGSLAATSAPVRDGLLAGYYGERRTRPEIQFYDTVGTAGGAVAAYGRAAAEGNDFVIGPLGRDEVSALFSQTELSVPMLALNRGNVSPPAGHASFSLTPEDEAISAAEYLLSRNARRVLVLSGGEPGMGRAVAAFRERFGERGGAVVDALTISEKTDGLLPALQAAAAREGGIDAVFLAVKATQARAAVPLLSAAGLSGTPRVATSQLMSGTGKAEQDRVLDGIIFPSDAWSARGAPGLPAASTTGQNLPTARGAAARLFAFGYDAWLITAYLERLATGSDAQVKGATGDLRIDGFGNVMRTPAWSTFSGGVAMPLSGGG
ncbi:MAG: penicillin-binding protein activator [Luteimonas sp.]